MQRSRKGWLVVAMGMTVALAGPMVDEAFAKKAKSSFTAKVAGKPMKALKGQIFLLYTSTSFSVAGQTGVRRGLSRAIQAVCLGNLKTLALPATINCYGSYTEARRKSAEEWSRNDGIQVRIETFDGSRATGTFSGALDATPSHPSDPPVAVESGSFSIVIQGL